MIHNFIFHLNYWKIEILFGCCIDTKQLNFSDQKIFPTFDLEENFASNQLGGDKLYVVLSDTTYSFTIQIV